MKFHLERALCCRHHDPIFRAGLLKMQQMRNVSLCVKGLVTQWVERWPEDLKIQSSNHLWLSLCFLAFNQFNVVLFSIYSLVVSERPQRRNNSYRFVARRRRNVSTRRQVEFSYGEVCQVREPFVLIETSVVTRLKKNCTTTAFHYKWHVSMHLFRAC